MEDELREMETIDPRSTVVYARRGRYGEFRYECWGERDGARLPGTVYVFDLAQLESELSMAGLTIPSGPACDTMRRSPVDFWTYSVGVSPS